MSVSLSLNPYHCLRSANVANAQFYDKRRSCRHSRGSTCRRLTLPASPRCSAPYLWPCQSRAIARARRALRGRGLLLVSGAGSRALLRGDGQGSQRPRERASCSSVGGRCRSAAEDDVTATRGFPVETVSSRSGAKKRWRSARCRCASPTRGRLPVKTAAASTVRGRQVSTSRQTCAAATLAALGSARLRRPRLPARRGRPAFRLSCHTSAIDGLAQWLTGLPCSSQALA